MEKSEVEMFYDAESRRVQVDDRIEALGRDFKREAALGLIGRRLATLLRLPVAAAELETTERALPGRVPPLHRCSTPPARLDRHARGI